MRELEKIAISNIFHDSNYLIPIYQRNYAWDELQIEQLIEDIHGATNNYFLGNLIINQRDNNVYEVIDGQQRLTTLFLIEKYLGYNFSKEALRFESRRKSNKTLSKIKSNGEISEIIEETLSDEIIDGYKIIDNIFKRNRKLEKEGFKNKLKKVFIIRVQVPPNIDLNHYFEIMNTRGEQLELHEIVKAKLIEKLESDEEKYTASEIWEKCSDMNSYIQMNFSKDIREKIFTNNWNFINDKIYDFDDLKNSICNETKTKIAQRIKEPQTLNEILRLSTNQEAAVNNYNEENERFESIISFPNFLLQVNSAMNKEYESNFYDYKLLDDKQDNWIDKENESNLDDNKLLDNLKNNWKNENNAKRFLFNLLKSRFIFDKYIIKREYIGDYKVNGQWSLKQLEKNGNGNKSTPNYINTFKEKNTNENDIDNNQLKVLQSCLRITYTSPKTMHWVTLVLKSYLISKNLNSVNLIHLLENYCRYKVAFSKYESKEGFSIERIVFTYLDYLLYRDGYEFKNIILKIPDKWAFQFRNSIEHFFPQTPIEEEKWDDALNCLGNLALITVSGNSKFSNLSPKSKADTYKKIPTQSLKLIIMVELTNNNEEGWTQKQAKIHDKEMFAILKKDIENRV